MHSRSSLLDIVQMFQDIDERVIERSECEQRNESKLILNHPLLNEIYELYTRYVFELMLNEYMKSHQYSVKREGESERRLYTDVDPGLYTVKDSNDKAKYFVKIRCKIYNYVMRLDMINHTNYRGESGSESRCGNL